MCLGSECSRIVIVGIVIVGLEQLSSSSSQVEEGLAWGNVVLIEMTME